MSEAEHLAREINAQAAHDPRVSMLHIPQVKVEDDQIVIAFYWYDRYASEAHDTVVQFADHAAQPPDQAAKRILDRLIDDTGSTPAG